LPMAFTNAGGRLDPSVRGRIAVGTIWARIVGTIVRPPAVTKTDRRSGRVAMTITELLRWQWQGYPRYHRSRVNLLLHVIVVPLFVLGSVSLIVAAVQRQWLTAGLGVVGMIGSVTLQGVGHRKEAVPPEPFRSPLDAVARLVLEQWITFPRFVVSGAWLRAWRGSDT